MSWRRSLQYGSSSALLVALLAAVLVFANLISNNHYRRLDTTAEGLFTLSPQTVKLLEGLDAPVQADAFFEPDGQPRADAEQLFEQYRAVSRHFQYRFIDPDKHPAETQSRGVTQYNTTVLTQRKREVKLTRHEESDLTSGLIRVTRETRRQIRFTTGHGERPLRGFDRDGLASVARALEDQGFELSELLLLESGEVPERTDVLVMAGPRKPLLPREVTALDGYLARGGDLVLLADPDSDTDLAPLLQPWGMEAGRQLIIDPTSRLFGGDFTVPLVSDYPYHPITDGFSFACFFPVARPVVHTETAGVTLTVIARTGPDAWGESAVDRQPVDRDEADLAGPVPVIVLAERSPAEVGDAPADPETAPPTPPAGGRLLVAGDADFPTNQWFNSSGNGDLFLNCVSWLAREEALVSIRPKDRSPQTLMLTPVQGATLFYGFVVGLPLGVLLLALGVWRWRRGL